MEKSGQRSPPQINDEGERKTNTIIVNNRNLPLIDNNNSRNVICGATKPQSGSLTASSLTATKAHKTYSVDKEAVADLTAKEVKPSIDASRISGTKKKKASFFTRQFSSFDGSSPSPIERFQSAIATAASVFSPSVGSHVNVVPSSNDPTTEHTASSNSSHAEHLRCYRSSTGATSNHEKPQTNALRVSPKRLTVGARKVDTNDNETVSNSVAALLSPSSGAKTKINSKSKKHRKGGRKGNNFLKRSGSHSPSIKRSPTRIVTENGSSCINLTVSDRSGPSSGNTTPSPRSFRRSAESSHRQRGADQIESSGIYSSQHTAARPTPNTLTVPSTSSAYGAIPRTTTTNQPRTHATVISNDEPPRRCFCGHYSEVIFTCPM